MVRKENSKMLKLPTCKYCGEQWLPQEGVVASRAFCGDCSKERRAKAVDLLGTTPIGRAEGLLPYVGLRAAHPR